MGGCSACSCRCSSTALPDARLRGAQATRMRVRSLQRSLFTRGCTLNRQPPCSTYCCSMAGSPNPLGPSPLTSCSTPSICARAMLRTQHHCKCRSNTSSHPVMRQTPMRTSACERCMQVCTSHTSWMTASPCAPSLPSAQSGFANKGGCMPALSSSRRASSRVHPVGRPVRLLGLWHHKDAALGPSIPLQCLAQLTFPDGDLLRRAHARAGRWLRGGLGCLHVQQQLSHLPV